MNMDQKKKVDITPHVSLFPKLGYSGYRMVEAISEFIDNSIDAKIENEKVHVGIILSERSVSVADNASGMNLEELRKALKLAFTEGKKKRLGYFGLGLKTAATSLGKKFLIRTTRKNDDHWYVFEYDESRWAETDKWESEIGLEEKPSKQTHGTEITIERPTYKFYPNLVTNLKKQLGFRFASFIESGEVKITLNGMMVERSAIDLINNEKTPIEIELRDGRKITGWYGFLTKREGQNFGFNLYKNGRLITPFKKIGFESHPATALLYGELNLDFVPTTHNKREFIENSVEYREVSEAIEEYLKKEKIIKRTRDLSKRKSIVKIEDNIRRKLSVLEKKLKKEPLIEKISEITTSEKIDSELKDEGKLRTIQIGQKFFSPDKMIEENKYEFRVENDNYVVRFGLLDLGAEEEWVKYKVEGNNILILINTDFPLYFLVRNYSYYSLILIAEAISEFIVKKYALRREHILKIRNLILRKAGEAQIEEDKRRKMEKERVALRIKLKAIDKELLG